MSHGDKIKNIPQDWLVTSKSENNIISSVERTKYLRCAIPPRGCSHNYGLKLQKFP